MGRKWGREGGSCSRLLAGAELGVCAQGRREWRQEASFCLPCIGGWLCLNERKKGPLMVFLQSQAPGLQKQISCDNTNMQKKIHVPNIIPRDLLASWGPEILRQPVYNMEPQDGRLQSESIGEAGRSLTKLDSAHPIHATVSPLLLPGRQTHMCELADLCAGRARKAHLPSRLP